MIDPTGQHPPTALFSTSLLLSPIEIVDRLHAHKPLSPRTTAWYRKSQLTFADLLEAVRAQLWQVELFSRLAPSLTPALFLEAERKALIQRLACAF